MTEVGSRITRRKMLGTTAAVGGGLAVASSPLAAFASRGGPRRGAVGYGEPVEKPPIGGIDPSQRIAVPPEFDYVVLDVQGTPMSDGQPTPGIFDGMGAYRGPAGTTVLIRNHENREQSGELKVTTGADFEYDQQAFGGNTKVVVDRKRNGRRGLPEKVDSFAILGGTSTNCAGGPTPWDSWITCEEVVKRIGGGPKHGYIFEIAAGADGPVSAAPIPAAGRFVHEAVAYLDGVLYETEDRSLAQGGSVLYRFLPDRRARGKSGDGHGPPGRRLPASGRLEALKVVGEDRADMNVGREIGTSYPVEWVEVPEPDHDDDTDSRTDRVPGLTPTRYQAQDNGAAVFQRQEGIWVDEPSGRGPGKVYFDCTSGGPLGLGQVWEYDPRADALTLIYESNDSALLQNPDNVVIVPATGDIFLQEDGGGEQFIRGVTTDGEIYDFARTTDNDSEFCGGCFDPKGDILYVNQQGGRGSLPDGLPTARGVTFAIVGPFHNRLGRG